MNHNSLELLAEQIKSCSLCPLAWGRTNAVPGEGPSRAEIVIIGEGPGKDEDVAGRPFVGRAGRLLDSALHSAKVRREDVFITNVVKCRPPRNRIPTKRERHVCVSTYLLRQLDMIGPNGVILLGRTASLVLLNERRLRDVRGKVITIKGMNFLPTYHPAAILRNPRLKRTFVSDLKKIHHVVMPKHKKET